MEIGNLEDTITVEGGRPFLDTVMPLVEADILEIPVTPWKESGGFEGEPEKAVMLGHWDHPGGNSLSGRADSPGLQAEAPLDPFGIPAHREISCPWG